MAADRPYDADVDIHFSPEEDGWYAADYSDKERGTTQIFPTAAELVKALEEDRVIWEP